MIKIGGRAWLLYSVTVKFKQTAIQRCFSISKNDKAVLISRLKLL
jgi:hypothetical protein